MDRTAEGEALRFEGGVEVSPELRARVDALGARLEAYRASYYKGEPANSDAAYDELRSLDPTHPVLARVGSSALVSEWEKARHEIPMGSLNKVVDEAELRAWLARCEELGRKDGLADFGHDLFVAEKLDGISLEAIYRDGKVAEAITRGDGEVGERITTNVARMKGVPAGDGRDLVLRLCSDCHGLKTAVAQRRSLSGWEDTMATMVGRGVAGRIATSFPSLRHSVPAESNRLIPIRRSSWRGQSAPPGLSTSITHRFS